MEKESKNEIVLFIKRINKALYQFKQRKFTLKQSIEKKLQFKVQEINSALTSILNSNPVNNIRSANGPQ